MEELQDQQGREVSKLNLSLKLNHIKNSDLPRVGRYAKNVNNTADARGRAALIQSRLQAGRENFAIKEWIFGSTHRFSLMPPSAISGLCVPPCKLLAE